MLSFLIISLIWSVTSIYGIGHCQSLTSRNQSLGGGSCSRCCSSRLDFLGEKIHVILRHLLGWLVGWFVGYTSTMNQRSFDVKRLREIPEPTGSIAFHCFNWTLSMSCAYQELWTLLKWKRWEQSLEPSRRSWNRRPMENEMHCRHSFLTQSLCLLGFDISICIRL